MLAMGIRLLFGGIKERCGIHSCKNCKSCGTEKNEEFTEEKSNHAALISMGFGYGISPCAPLILITGYASTLNIGYAAILGMVFSLASTLSPALLIMLLSGVLAKRMHKEIPQYITWFRLGCYVLMIVLFAAGLIKAIINQ